MISPPVALVTANANPLFLLPSGKDVFYSGFLDHSAVSFADVDVVSLELLFVTVDGRVIVCEEIVFTL